jgi:hypothetical protein
LDKRKMNIVFISNGEGDIAGDIFVIKPLKIIPENNTPNPNIIAKLMTNIGHKEDIMQITMIKKVLREYQ